MSTAPPVTFDLDAADLFACEHVGYAELSLWYCQPDNAFVVVLCDVTVLAVFEAGEEDAAVSAASDRAAQYYADVLTGLRLATAVPQ